MQAGPPQGVGRTALGVARVRARESKRGDRLFDDPFAQAFVDAAPGVFPEEPQPGGPPAAAGPLARLGAAFYVHAVVRTRFYDEYLTAAAAAGGVQLVLLAAGLDTRAFRLTWPPGTRLFEVDLPAVLAFKEEVLAAGGAVPRCERTAVPADLREDWPQKLADAGFGPGQPTAWLAEGLLIYLAPGQVTELFTAVTGQSPAGSRLAFEHNPAGRDALTARAARLPAMRQYTSLWQGGLAEAPGWLAGHGWDTAFHPLADVARGYGRPLPDPARSGFLTAVRTG